MNRRAILGVVAAAGAGATLWSCKAQGMKSEEDHEPEVTPGEDLMQEHGVLERLLLVYEESIRRLEHGATVDPSVLADAANIVRRFVEDYHEQLEERFVFPRLEAGHREVELVAILRLQHQRGRKLTNEILAHPGAPSMGPLRAFVRMYRPHAAREDTVLFPAFRHLVGGPRYRELGEQFEEEEHARFGAHGFDEIVSAVARLEASLEISDLGSFTPS